jgi:probable addiction module antidote protein
MKDKHDEVQFSAYDTAEHLRTAAEIRAYLEAVFEEYGHDSRVVVAALGDVARAQGMQKIARETGLNREGLYQALSGKGNPSFDTVLKVMNAVGVELRPKALTRLRSIPNRRARKTSAGQKKARARLAPTKQKKRSQSSKTKARRSR